MTSPDKGANRASAENEVSSENEHSSEAGSANVHFSSANPPSAPSGLSSSLQPGGLIPRGGPAASTGGLGTGGGQVSEDTGSMKSEGR
jgi:hypothetical protein